MFRGSAYLSKKTGLELECVSLCTWFRGSAYLSKKEGNTYLCQHTCTQSTERRSTQHTAQSAQSAHRTSDNTQHTAHTCTALLSPFSSLLFSVRSAAEEGENRLRPSGEKLVL